MKRVHGFWFLVSGFWFLVSGLFIVNPRTVNSERFQREP